VVVVSNSSYHHRQMLGVVESNSRYHHRKGIVEMAVVGNLKWWSETAAAVMVVVESKLVADMGCRKKNTLCIRSDTLK
jgi:hypothetical protein